MKKSIITLIFFLAISGTYTHANDYVACVGQIMTWMGEDGAPLADLADCSKQKLFINEKPIPLTCQEYTQNGKRQAACLPDNCTPRIETRCDENKNIFAYDSCGLREAQPLSTCSANQYCRQELNEATHKQQASCVQKEYVEFYEQKCFDNDVYNVDNYGGKKIAYTCEKGKYICKEKNVKVAECEKNPDYNQLFEQRCVGNDIYWFSSINEKQSKSVNSCGKGLICQNAKCVIDPKYVIQRKNKRLFYTETSKAKKPYDLNTELPLERFNIPEASFEIPKGTINKNFFKSTYALFSSTANMTGITLPSGETIYNNNGFKIVTKTHIHDEFQLASCISQEFKSVKLPHTHIQIQQKPFDELVFDLRIGVYQKNGKKCTFVYEDVMNSAKPFCKTYCEAAKNYKTPKDIITDATRYPINIDKGTLDDIAQHNGINGDWPTTTPLITIDKIGQHIMTFAVVGVGTVAGILIGTTLIITGVAA